MIPGFETRFEPLHFGSMRSDRTSAGISRDTPARHVTPSGLLTHRPDLTAGFSTKSFHYPCPAPGQVLLLKG